MGRFDELSDLDFEELVADLMRADLDLPFRAGTRGRDAGIDVLAKTRQGRKHVVQCKHYRDSSYARLKKAAQDEAEGLQRRRGRFASYRFVTSRRLNHRQRGEIAGILAAWVESEEYVLGEGDLRRLLGEYPKVEGRHVKLWLSGAGQLQRMLSAAAYERSGALLEDTRAALGRYVQTESFVEAREILRREGVCVIAGPPGVGKTTLARLLLVDALEEGFQPYEVVPGGLSEAWQLLSIDEPQLFYFDDFLGRTALHESREADAELLRFMRRVARDEKRRFVLTTREYVLRQAQRLSEILDRETDEAHKFLLTIDTYTRRERARIFYNHIYFSDQVDSTARAALLRRRGYLAVVDHRNYSPRLIEWITGLSAHRLTDRERHAYSNFCLAVLEEPEALWSHAFERGLSDADRALLLALIGLPRRVAYGDAERAFLGACDARSLDPGGRLFQHVLAVLDDSFIATHQSGGVIYLSYQNPSLIDYLRKYLADSRPDAEALLRGARFFEQVVWLWGALGDDGAGPGEDLIPAFATALRGTFDAQPVEGERSFDSLLQRRTDWDAPEGRLRSVLELCQDEPALLNLSKEWLSRYAEEWGSSVGEQWPVTSSSIRLLGQLAGAGLLDLRPHSERIKQRVLQMDPQVDRWDYLDDLRRLGSGVIDDDEWKGEGEALAEYAHEVLADPAAYFSEFDELDNLVSVSDYYGIDLDDSDVATARDEIAEWHGDRDYESEEYEPDDPREAPGGGESDDDIVAMFGRLAQE